MTSALPDNPKELVFASFLSISHVTRPPSLTPLDLDLRERLSSVGVERHGRDELLRFHLGFLECLLRELVGFE